MIKNILVSFFNTVKNGFVRNVSASWHHIFDIQAITARTLRSARDIHCQEESVAFK